MQREDKRISELEQINKYPNQDDLLIIFNKEAGEAGETQSMEFSRLPEGGGAKVTSVNGRIDNVVLDKDDVGLGNVDNLSKGDILTSVPDGVNPSDAVNKKQLDERVERDTIAINVLDFGVVGDGSVDESVALNSILAGGNKQVYFPEGEYMLDNYVRIHANTHISLHKSAVIKNNLTSGNVMMMNGERGNPEYAYGYGGDGNITIEGGTFDCGPRTGRPANSMSIAFAHAEGIKIVGSRFINNRQDHQLEFNACKNVIVDNCTFINTELTSPSSREFINIDHSFSTGFPHFGGYDGTICENITIRDSTFIDGDVSVGSHSPPEPLRHKSIRMINNYIENMTSHGITSQYWIDSTISGNTIINSGSTGVRAGGTINSIISGNIIDGGCSNAAIASSTDSSLASERLIIESNYIDNISGSGIDISAGQSIVVGNRLYSSSTTNDGLTMNGGLCTASSNIVSGYRHGIRLATSSQSVVNGNLLNNYADSGVLIGASSDTGTTFDTLIFGNRMRSGGSVSAVKLESRSTRAQVFGNRMRDGGPVADSGSGTAMTADNTTA